MNQMLNVMATNLLHWMSRDTERVLGKHLHENISQQTGNKRQSSPRKLIPPYKRNRIPIPPRRIRHGAYHRRRQIRGRRRHGPSLSRTPVCCAVELRDHLVRPGFEGRGVGTEFFTC
jgi:hypothetical protein